MNAQKEIPAGKKEILLSQLTSDKVGAILNKDNYDVVINSVLDKMVSTFQAKVDAALNKGSAAAQKVIDSGPAYLKVDIIFNKPRVSIDPAYKKLLFSKDVKTEFIKNATAIVETNATAIHTESGELKNPVMSWSKPFEVDASAVKGTLAFFTEIANGLNAYLGIEAPQKAKGKKAGKIAFMDAKIESDKLPLTLKAEMTKEGGTASVKLIVAWPEWIEPRSKELAVE